MALDGLDAGRDRDGLEGSASTERTIPDVGDAIWEDYGPEGFAIIECVLPDRGNAGRDRDGLEGGAPLERRVLDRSDAIGYRYLLRLLPFFRSLDRAAAGDGEFGTGLIEVPIRVRIPLAWRPFH